jgi:hypothetical protein
VATAGFDHAGVDSPSNRKTGLAIMAAGPALVDRVT